MHDWLLHVQQKTNPCFFFRGTVQDCRLESWQMLYIYYDFNLLRIAILVLLCLKHTSPTLPDDITGSFLVPVIDPWKTFKYLYPFVAICEHHSYTTAIPHYFLKHTIVAFLLRWSEIPFSLIPNLPLLQYSVFWMCLCFFVCGLIDMHRHCCTMRMSQINVTNLEIIACEFMTKIYVLPFWIVLYGKKSLVLTLSVLHRPRRVRISLKNNFGIMWYTKRVVILQLCYQELTHVLYIADSMINC